MGYGKNDKVQRRKNSLDAFWLIGIFFCGFRHQSERCPSFTGLRDHTLRTPHTT